MYSRRTNFVHVNAYGDVNKSGLAFADGHAAYLKIYPGNTTQSFRNPFYTFVFEELRLFN